MQSCVSLMSSLCPVIRRRVVFSCNRVSSRFLPLSRRSRSSSHSSSHLSAPATTPAFGGGEACGVALRSRCSPTLRSHTRSFTLRSRTLALRRRSHILNLRRRRRSLAVRRRGGYAPAPAPAVGFGGQSLLAPQPAAAGFGGGAGGFGGGAGGFGVLGAGGFGGGGFGKGGGKGGRF